MSNKTIDEILKENNLEFISFTYPNMYPRIRKAIGQYGKGCHADGMREGHSHGIAWAGKYLPELIKLRELVKAQKELIVLLGSEKLNPDAVIRGFELRNKIKQLES